MYSDMCHDKFKVEKEFDWEMDCKIESLTNYRSNILKTNIIENKDIYKSISDSVIDLYIELNFPLYKQHIDEFREFNKLRKKEMSELLFSFLSTFDSNLYKQFKEKSQEGLILKDKSDEYDSLGITYEIAALKKNFMFANTSSDGKETIRVAATVMHEFGHNYEMQLYLNSGIKNYMYLYPFHEVSSQFFEYAFINYLIENKMFIKDVELYQRITYFELFYFMFGINLFAEIEKEDTNQNEYILDFNKLKEKELKLQERVNYYGISDLEYEEFDKCFIYGIGYLFSPYLYENYKQDPKNFMKEFQNVLLTYPYTNSINSFERVGVTPEILIEGKTLRKVLDSIK